MTKPPAPGPASAHAGSASHGASAQRVDPLAAQLLARAAPMRTSLTALLDRVPGSRNGLPHLAALEVSLSRQGLAILDTISAPVLTKVCTQMSSLPIPKDDRPLQSLLLLLVDTLESLQPPRVYPSDFMTDSRLMVEEGSFTDFAAAGGDFEGTKPGRF